MLAKLSRYCSIAICLGGLLSLSSGCATVRPADKLLDPVAVYIGDYGVHSSLFLPTHDGRYVEYARGDWGYAVENHNLPQDAVGALTASQGAAFGRLYHSVAANGGPAPRHKPRSMQKVMCERADVWVLIDRFDVRYETLRDKHGPGIVNPETGITWVRDDLPYSIANNCNHLTAEALRELGCRVSGVVVLSNFDVAQPATPSRPASKPLESVPGWAAIE